LPEALISQSHSFVDATVISYGGTVHFAWSGKVARVSNLFWELFPDNLKFMTKRQTTCNHVSNENVVGFYQYTGIFSPLRVAAQHLTLFLTYPEP
jgi:hypothetical protein